MKEKMITSKKSMDKKVMLSTLWLFALLNYLYCDVITVMDPIKDVTIQLTPGFLLGAAFLLEIPIGMVLLSRILKNKANRKANIISGIIMTAVQTLTLFIGTPTMYYAFFSAIEIACTLYIVWYAWNWTETEIYSQTR